MTLCHPQLAWGSTSALFIEDDKLAEKMRAIRTHGGLQRHHHPYIGMNGRFDTIQAAILPAKLECFDWEVQRRLEIGDRYSQLITNGCRQVTPPCAVEGNTHVYAQYTIRSQNRDALVEKIREQESR